MDPIKVAVIVVLLAITLGDAAFAQEHKTYRCKVADVVSLSADGRLHANDDSRDLMRQIYDDALIDTLTGAVTYRGGGRRVWKVIQKGGDVNDYVLTPDTPVWASATDFIRVRAWKQQPTVRFLVFMLSTLASGRCEVVH